MIWRPTLPAEQLQRQHQELIEELRGSAPDRRIAKLVVKLKFSDFQRTTAEQAVPSRSVMARYLQLLDDAWGRSGQAVRLLGIGVRFAEAHAGPSSSNWQSRRLRCMPRTPSFNRVPTNR